ncbi:MAG: ribosome assembly RNA-binding protein YhbY [Lachnospiraceae bacterium]|nr:ribosome assembly RNA-binding protein YhbY [Lachnospiraceae bacterium]
MTSKQRAQLKGMAMTMDSILNIGKESLTYEFIAAVEEALEARELIKINVLKNCDDDVRDIGNAIAERTDSELVQTIGRKIVLYRQARKPENRKIKLK